MAAIWKSTRDLLRSYLSPLLVILLIAFALKEFTPITALIERLFRSMGDTGQTMFLLVLIGLIAWGVVLQVNRESRVTELKAERASLEQRLAGTEAELAKRDETLMHLAEVEVRENPWRRVDKGTVRFVPPEERRARFLAILNLKGGAGKTTIAANLAACLARMPNPLKVLAIDLDFQGTLSNMSVEPSILALQRERSDTSAKLLADGFSTGDLKRLIVAMNKVPSANVIVSDDSLEQADFQKQAAFFVNPEKEARFCHRSALHCPEVADQYDLVLFDCPPRLTTSSVNALACSDYVLLPSKLDEKSFEAVPRSLKFISQLVHIARPKIVGVVVNEAEYWRKGILLKPLQNGLVRLKEIVRDHDPDLYVFSSLIEHRTDIAYRDEKGVVPCADDRIRDVFLPFANELRDRIKK